MNDSRMDAPFPGARTGAVVSPCFKADHRNRNPGEFHFEKTFSVERRDWGAENVAVQPVEGE